MSMWQHCTECPHVLRLSDSLPLHVDTTLCLSMHSSMNTWVALILQLLGVTASVNMTIYIFKTLLLIFFGYLLKSGIAGSYGNYIYGFFLFLEGFPYCLPQQLYDFAHPSKVCKSSSFSMSLPMLVAFCFLIVAS